VFQSVQAKILLRTALAFCKGMAETFNDVLRKHGESPVGE